MRYLIVGAGSAGQRHFSTLKSLGVPPSDIYVTDIVPEIPLEKFSGATMMPSQKTAEALVAFTGVRKGSPKKTQEPAAVIIATPPESHISIALESVNRGLHVLIEKPISTINSKDKNEVYHASQLDLLSKSKNRTVMVANNYRYAKGYRELVTEVKKADEVYSVYSYYGSRSAAHKTENILSRITVHQLNYTRDLVRSFLSKENTIPPGAEISNPSPEVVYNDIDVAVTLETPLCTAFISSNIVSENRVHSVVVETSNGHLRWNDFGAEDEINQMNKSMMKHFMDCCALGTPPLTGLIDALNDVRLLKVKV